MMKASVIGIDVAKQPATLKTHLEAACQILTNQAKLNESGATTMPTSRPRVRGDIDFRADEAAADTRKWMLQLH